MTKKIINGVIYDGSEEGFYIRDEKMREGPDSLPDIICSCGNTRFELRYGKYEMIATCPSCGKSETVYDG